MSLTTGRCTLSLYQRGLLVAHCNSWERHSIVERKLSTLTASSRIAMAQPSSQPNAAPIGIESPAGPPPLFAGHPSSPAFTIERPSLFARPSKMTPLQIRRQERWNASSYPNRPPLIEGSSSRMGEAPDSYGLLSTPSLAILLEHNATASLSSFATSCTEPQASRRITIQQLIERQAEKPARRDGLLKSEEMQCMLYSLSKRAVKGARANVRASVRKLKLLEKECTLLSEDAYVGRAARLREELASRKKYLDRVLRDARQEREGIMRLKALARAQSDEIELRCAQAPTAHELSLVPAGKTSRWGVYPHDVLAQARFWSAYKTFCAGNVSEDGKSPLQYEGRVIDLYVLHTVVADLGGAEAVTRHGLWPFVGGKLGFSQVPATSHTPAISSLSSALYVYKIYCEYLDEYNKRSATSADLEDKEGAYHAQNCQLQSDLAPASPFHCQPSGEAVVASGGVMPSLVTTNRGRTYQYLALLQVIVLMVSTCFFILAYLKTGESWFLLCAAIEMLIGVHKKKPVRMAMQAESDGRCTAEKGWGVEGDVAVVAEKSK